MELPNYRIPSAKSVGQLIWDKAKDFVTRAFTVIFRGNCDHLVLADIRYQTECGQMILRDSLLALIGSAIAPVFAPLGFGDWRDVDSIDYRIHGEGKCG